MREAIARVPEPTTDGEPAPPAGASGTKAAAEDRESARVFYRPEDIPPATPAEREEAARVIARLRASGAIVAPPDDEDLPDDDSDEAIERDLEEWLASLPGPLRLAEAIIEERQHR